MGRKRKGLAINGWINLDKPAGMTSAACVNAVRRATGGQIPDTMKARGLSREEVINDVLLAKQPTKKFVQPHEIGALAVFLCREEAGNVTGANWSIDGGWTAE